MNIQRIARVRDSLFCEIWFGAWLLFVRARAFWQKRFSADVAMQTSPMLFHRKEYAATKVFLRKVLRNYPTWAEGHVRLGLTELKLQNLADEPVSPRAQATIRLSALAAKGLLAKQSGAILKGRVELEAEFLEASLVFFAKRHREALGLYESLLTPEHSVQVSEEVYLSALENAGALALLLDEKEKAFRYFLEIPETKRTGEATSALRLLQGPSSDTL